METQPRVIAVCQSAKHRFSKLPALEIRVVAGLGVEGDAHSGVKTQHRYDRKHEPDRPNLRQVHLLDVSLFCELRSAGFDIQPGDLGENIATLGINLTALPTGTVLHAGDHAQLELTGLREPCVLIDRFMPGLQNAVRGLGYSGKPFLRAGVMTRVLKTGIIRPGDKLEAEYPSRPWLLLKNV